MHLHTGLYVLKNAFIYLKGTVRQRAGKGETGGRCASHWLQLPGLGRVTHAGDRSHLLLLSRDDQHADGPRAGEPALQGMLELQAAA